MPDIRTTLTLPAEWAPVIKEIAERELRSVNNLILIALRTYFAGRGIGLPDPKEEN